MRYMLSADGTLNRLVLTGLLCVCVLWAHGPVDAAEANLNMVFTTTDAGGSYNEAHVHIVWLETASGQFVCTVGTNSGNRRSLWANSRAYSLKTWWDMNPERSADVDARTGATQTVYRSYDINWNWRERDGSMVPDGTYRLRFLCTNADSGTPNNEAIFTNVVKGGTGWSFGPTSRGGYSNVSLAFTPATLGVSAEDAAEVTGASARLNGYVTGTGAGGDPAVYIYWGDEDGGTDPAGWDEEIVVGTMGAGGFGADVAGLIAGTTYYYRCYVENSSEGLWSATTASFKAIPTTTVFKEGDEWHYYKGVHFPGDGWNVGVLANPDGWLTGPTGIGYGDDDDRTVLGDMREHYWTVYMRYTFRVDDPGGVEKMVFSADYDDGFVAYINGKDVMRRGFGENETVLFNTPADSHGASVDGGDIATKELSSTERGYLVQGENVFAIEVHNTTLGSSDLTMIPELTMVGGLREPQGDVKVTPGELDFSTVDVGEFADLSFDVENTGSLDLLVGSLEVAGLDKGAYSVLSSPAVPFSLAALGGKASVDVRFSPGGVQDYNYAEVAVGSDDPDEPAAVVSLRGSGGPAATVELNAVAGVGGDSRAAAIYEDYALVGEGSVLRIYDVVVGGGVTRLEVVGEIALAEDIEDIAVGGDVAYVATGLGGVQIIQLADVSSPSLAGGFATDGFACSVAISETRALVADGGSVYVLDASNALSPSLIAKWDSDGRAFGVAVDSDYGYVANGDRGIEVLSLANGASVASFDTAGVAYGVTVVGGIAYVADGTSGMQVLDVSGLPGSPLLVGGLDTPGIATDVTVIGGRVCVADSVAGVSIVDVSIPGAAQLYARSSATVRSLSAAVTDSRVVVADGAGGVAVLAPQGPAGTPSGDTNGDNVVDFVDLAEMLDNWLGEEAMLDVLVGNLNDDTTVDLADFATVAVNWLVMQIVLPNPDGRWGFDEESGDVAVDTSGNRHNGTLRNMNDEDWVAGVEGNALAFDGVDDFVLVDGYKGVLGSASRTFAAWIRCASLDGEYHTIASWGNDSTGGRWLIVLKDDSDGHGGVLTLMVMGGRIVGSKDLRDDKWHHIAVVLADDGSADVSEVVLYVDGVAEDITVRPPVAVNTGDASGGLGTSDVVIGKFYRDGAELYFEGMIDEVRIYDRALSDGEVAELAK